MKDMIEEKLKNIIVSVSSKQIDSDEIVEDTSFVYDLGMDSISLVKMMVEVEEEFGIEIIDGYTAIDKMTDFKSLAEYIESKKER